MSIGVERPTTIPALPKECEELYLASSMNQSDREEILRMIAGYRPSLWGRVKESLPVLVVMAGSAFVNAYLPEKIGNQTRSMGEDIVSLKTSTGTLQHDVAEMKGEIKDALNKAFGRALDNLQSRPPRSSKGSKDRSSAALELGASALRLARTLDLSTDPSLWNKALDELGYRYDCRISKH